MMLKEVIGTAWKSITSNKSRSILTMLGVIIGVAAVIIMMAVSAGTEADISDAITGLGSNLIYIRSSMQRGGPSQSSSSSTSLVYDDVWAIRDQVDGVDGVTVEQSTTLIIKYDSTTLEDITLVGTTTDYPSVRDLSVANGRFFNQTEMDRASKVVVLGSSLATKLFGSEDPVGKVITATETNTKVTVIGVLEPKGLVSGTNFDEQMYAPIQLLFKKFTFSMFARIMGNDVRLINVAVNKDSNMDTVVGQIKILLAKRHNITVEESTFNVQTQQDIIATREATTSSFRTLLAWVAGVSLVVGGIGIMNIMLVSVTERTREIGLRQAVGANPRDIQVQFLSEALMLSLFGGLLGVLAGVGGSYLFSKLGSMRTVIVPYSIILSFTSAALVGIFFGYIPARTAAQLDPIEALRHD